MKYENTATLTHLCILYGCFHASVAELSSCDNRDCTAKSKILIIWLLKEEVYQLLI